MCCINIYQDKVTPFVKAECHEKFSSIHVQHWFIWHLGSWSRGERLWKLYRSCFFILVHCFCNWQFSLIIASTWNMEKKSKAHMLNWSEGKCIQRRIYKEFKSINILVKVNHLKQLTYIWSAGCPLWTIEQLNPLPRAKSSTLLFCQCHGQIGATVKSCDLGQIFT